LKESTVDGFKLLLTIENIFGRMQKNISWTINVNIHFAMSAFLLGIACTPAVGGIIFVDGDATGINSGAIWADNRAINRVSYRDAKDRVRQETQETSSTTTKEDTVTQLIKALGDRDGMVRMNAAKALSIMGPSAEPAIPALIKMLLEDKDNANGMWAARALGRIGLSALPAVMKLLKHENRDVRMHAITALGEMGPSAEPAIPTLIKMLEGELHWHAVSALGSIGSAAVPELMKVLEGKGWPINFYAAVALGEMGSAAKPAKPILLKMLGDENETVRMFATETIVKIDPSATPEFVETMNDVDDPHAKIRGHALDTLADMGPSTLPILFKMLESKNDFVQRYIIGALARVCPLAIPMLMEALKHEKGDVRMRAAMVFDWIGPDDGVLGFEIALDDEDSSIRKFAIEALCRKKGFAIPSLIKALDNEDDFVRRHASEAIGEIGSLAGAALPKLNQLARRDKDAGVRNAAKEAIESISFEITALIRALDSENHIVGEQVIGALVRMGPPVVPALIKALDDEDAAIRSRVAQALGRIGSPAKDALPKLKELAEKDEIVDVRNTAKEAMERIQQDIRTRPRPPIRRRVPIRRRSSRPYGKELLPAGKDYASIKSTSTGKI